MAADNHRSICPDWFFNMNSNTPLTRPSVVTNRAWFISYTEYPSYVVADSGERLEVLGVGEIEIQTKWSLGREGKVSHGPLRVRNVLYIPTARCNLLAGLLLPNGEKGNRLIWVHPHDPMRVKALAPPNGFTSHETASSKPVNLVAVTWPNEEQIKFANFKSGRVEEPQFPRCIGRPVAALGKLLNIKLGQIFHRATTTSTTPQPRPAEKLQSNEPVNTSSQLYTEAEMSYLTKNWGREYKFLQTYDLSIDNEEDRAKGRDLLRALMAQEKWVD